LNIKEGQGWIFCANNMQNTKIKLLRIGGIAGMFYTTGRKTDTIVVYGIGAPLVPDSGNLPDAPYILKHNVDLFVPDYIGYGRSDGTCTPVGCIKTFLELYEAFLGGVIAESHYEKLKISLEYKRIIFIGRSFGATYVTLLPKFNPDIKEICSIYGALNNKACGDYPGEESNEDWLSAMEKDGYHHLYRGILSKKWKGHLNNEDGLSPMDNVKYLRNAKVFIAHSRDDRVLHYSQSENYYNKIISELTGKESQFKLQLYKGTGHDPGTSNRAVADFLDWLKV